MTENKPQEAAETVDSEREQRVEEHEPQMNFNVDKTSGVAELVVTVDESRIAELPDDWDVEDFVEARAQQYLKQDLKNIYSLTHVKTMVSEVDGFHSLSGDDKREFEVWAKW